MQQSTTVSGEKSVAETYGWKHTQGVKVTASAKVGIPLIGSTQITVEGSLSFEQNGSTTTSRKFAWQQPVLVPAKSKVVAHHRRSPRPRSTCPTRCTGHFVYASGLRVPGTSGGMFTGVNGHDLDVTLTQFNLDGTPAARPVDQPPRGACCSRARGVELFAHRLVQVGVIRHPGQRVAEVVDEAARALDHQRLDALERVLEHAQRAEGVVGRVLRAGTRPATSRRTPAGVWATSSSVLRRRRKKPRGRARLDRPEGVGSRREGMSR